MAIKNKKQDILLIILAFLAGSYFSTIFAYHDLPRLISYSREEKICICKYDICNVLCEDDLGFAKEIKYQFPFIDSPYWSLLKLAISVPSLIAGGGLLYFKLKKYSKL